MLQFPNLDPVAFELGPLKVHWYGLMYLFAFLSAGVIAHHRSKAPHSLIAKHDVENLVTYGAFGVILGARIGYVVFYGFDRWMEDPLWLFRIWDGGMSFHGGLLGVIVAMIIFAKRIRVPFVSLMDFVAPMVPLGLGFGRMGNFIGQELWGRVTTVPWAMVFPKAGDPAGIGRHPSQLYQATLEGLVLFIILWFSAKPRPRGAVCGLFLLIYSTFRSIIENFRQPDANIGFDLFGTITRGQLLSFPMFVVGTGLIIYAYLGDGKKILTTKKITASKAK
jgi:phosphatidylglycerol---prolipoprotein diacylglyceryl transferase